MLKILLCISLLCLANSENLDENDESGSSTAWNGVDDELASAINDFGFKLLKQMMNNRENAKNIVISPAGISGLLAMTLLGSVGESYEELAQVLGFSTDVKINREHHIHFGELLQTLNTDNGTSKTMYADVIFADPNAKLRDAYRNYLQRVYRGEAMNLSFKDQERAKVLINEWVKDHTEGKIPNFLKTSLPVDTQVVLLSALYFIGQWKHPFLIDYTKKLPFKTPNGTVMVDQMLNMGNFPYLYSYDDDLQIVAFPYNDSTNTMYVLKPRRPRHQTLSDLLNNLDYNKIDTLISRMTYRKCIIRYPKMDLQKSENLEEPLKALGIKSIFMPKKANFALMIDSNSVQNKTEDELISRINAGDVESRTLKEIVDNLPNPGVFVDTILHDIKITIDEYGTEAVAATSGLLARTAEQFYADTPFLMLIRNEKNKLVTFSGVIFDPTS